MTSLTGLSVIVTRPEEAGKELTQMLSGLGADAIHEPMFLIEPISSQMYTKLFINLKPSLLIATSVFAVKTAGTYISKHHKSWLISVPIIGIGPATAGALHAQGWHNVSYPKVFNSEGILDMRATAHVRNKSIVILTGAHGRNLLAPELSRRGAAITQVDGYERRPRHHINPTVVELLAKKPVLVVLTSVEAWQTLEQLVVPVNPQLLKTVVFVVASKRIAEVIWKQHCQQQIIIANHASNEAIVAAVTGYKETQHE